MDTTTSMRAQTLRPGTIGVTGIGAPTVDTTPAAASWVMREYRVPGAWMVVAADDRRAALVRPRSRPGEDELWVIDLPTKRKRRVFKRPISGGDRSVGTVFIAGRHLVWEEVTTYDLEEGDDAVWSLYRLDLERPSAVPVRITGAPVALSPRPFLAVSGTTLFVTQIRRVTPPGKTEPVLEGGRLVALDLDAERMRTLVETVTPTAQVGTDGSRVAFVSADGNGRERATVAVVDARDGRSVATLRLPVGERIIKAPMPIGDAVAIYGGPPSTDDYGLRIIGLDGAVRWQAGSGRWNLSVVDGQLVTSVRSRTEPTRFGLEAIDPVTGRADRVTPEPSDADIGWLPGRGSSGGASFAAFSTRNGPRGEPTDVTVRVYRRVAVR
jgi:hypothetical protein